MQLLEIPACARIHLINHILLPSPTSRLHRCNVGIRVRRLAFVVVEKRVRPMAGYSVCLKVGWGLHLLSILPYL